MKISPPKPSPARSSLRPTLAVVAKEAGVSKETVSHILGNKADRYHEETRKKVQDAAKKLNYRPHRAAQLMRGAKSNLIGIIHFGASHQNAIRAAYQLPQVIQKAGYDTFVVDLSWHSGNLKRAVDLLIEARVEGVIIMQMVENFGVEELHPFIQSHIPIVSLAGNEKLGIPCVYGDSGVVFEEVVRHLVDLGRRSLLLLANDYQSRPTRSRIEGFTRGIEGEGGALVTSLNELCDGGGEGVRGMIVQIPASRVPYEIGAAPYAFTRQLIENGLLPEVIVASNDNWAQAIFAAALESGVRIPQDLSVTGFDNEAFSAHAPYYLTTGAPDVEEECRKVVEILMELIAGRSLPQQHYIFPCRMIVRRSCGADTAKVHELPKIPLPI